MTEKQENPDIDVRLLRIPYTGNTLSQYKKDSKWFFCWWLYSGEGRMINKKGVVY